MLRTTVVLLTVVGLSSAIWEQASWDLYKKVYEKSYNGVDEMMRQQLFAARLHTINDHNLRHDLGLETYRMGVNQFTDLRSDEMKKYTGLRFNASRRSSKGDRFDHGAVRGDLPDTVDWRDKGYVTPVKNQQQCGSCWAFSATGSLEGQHFKKTGKLVSLSEQNLVDCSGAQGNNGCGGGDMDLAFNYVKENGGIDTEQAYPYTAQDGTCKFSANDIGAKCSGYVEIESGSEEALKKAVATIGPISVGIDASQTSFHSYSGGIYNAPVCSTTDLDHGVLVVGYGAENGVDYWLVKNSWGSAWGEKGYIRMSRNRNNQCGIATQALYPNV